LTDIDITTSVSGKFRGGGETADARNRSDRGIDFNKDLIDLRFNIAGLRVNEFDLLNEEFLSTGGQISSARVVSANLPYLISSAIKTESIASVLRFLISTLLRQPSV
jgi:hypothetical protein